MYATFKSLFYSYTYMTHDILLYGMLLLACCDRVGSQVCVHSFVVYICMGMLYNLASISACACILCFMYAYCAQVNDSECNSLEHTVHDNGHTVKGYALFGGPTLTGRVTFVSIIRQMLFQESCMCYS